MLHTSYAMCCYSLLSCGGGATRCCNATRGRLCASQGASSLLAAIRLGRHACYRCHHTDQPSGNLDHVSASPRMQWWGGVRSKGGGLGRGKTSGDMYIHKLPVRRPSNSNSHDELRIGLAVHVPALRFKRRAKENRAQPHDQRPRSTCPPLCPEISPATQSFLAVPVSGLRTHRLEDDPSVPRCLRELWQAGEEAVAGATGPALLAATRGGGPGSVDGAPGSRLTRAPARLRRLASPRGARRPNASGADAERPPLGRADPRDIRPERARPHARRLLRLCPASAETVCEASAALSYMPSAE